jgi:YjjG family noncanonical pyrimidine nucleotidase
MPYELFLFDLDDTLLDFKESERLSFYSTLQGLGVNEGLDALFARYQVENSALWKLFEQGRTTKEHLKIERFRKVFEANRIAIDPASASARYLETLPTTVVLIDHAEEICRWLSRRGEIGIITNGIQSVQTERIRNSKLAPYVGFVSVSEECGFAKPDARFFEYSARKASKFAKASSIVIGDRWEADIQGAHGFGLDACWFNPGRAKRPSDPALKFEIAHLSELKPIVTD